MEAYLSCNKQVPKRLTSVCLYFIVPILEASSVCVSVLQPLETPPSFFLLDYFLSGIEFRGKGFHGVVLAPLRLNSISDTLIEAEEGSPFIFLPWQLYFDIRASKHYHCHHIIYISKAISHSNG